MTARIVASLLAAAAVALLLSGGAVATHQQVITQAHSGKTFRLLEGGTATLRLSGKWAWTDPKVSSRAITLTPILFFRDPGYRQWDVTARAPGTATIRSTGTPQCTGCGLATRAFRVSIVVG